jgi:uncharacterized membrane protein
MRRTNTLFMVQIAIFTAIELIFCFTPLGSLPLGPGIVATLAHIPAIIVALVLGKKAATYMGAVMGLSSLIIWTFMPPNPLVAFAFSPFAPNGNIWSLIICVVPRVLFPLITAIIYEKAKPRLKPVLSAALSAIIGTAIHSALVLSLIYFAFSSNPVVGGSYTTFIVAWGGINAIMEIVVAAIISAGIIVPLSRINKKA